MKRQSILTDNMEECIICKTTRNIEIHHVIYGTANRKNSEKYKLIVPLCNYHHTGSNDSVHRNKALDTKLKKYAQSKFEEAYPELDFLKIFGKNYK